MSSAPPDPRLARALAGACLLGLLWSCARAPRVAKPPPPTAFPLNTERLTPDEAALRERTMALLDPVIAQKKRDGTANVMTWDELYAPLGPTERAFINQFRGLNAEALGATSRRFDSASDAPLAAVGEERISKNGAPSPLDPQYLPRRALEAYQAMMAAMQRDLGRRLLVESGYRSPAYQLYLFLHYLPNHELSIRETNRHVALPGYSEHGAPQRQAIDFINQDGVNGEDHPEEFEALPEYAWLQANAGRFGFFLSYPRGNAQNTAFEPWHWHFEEPR